MTARDHSPAENEPAGSSPAPDPAAAPPAPATARAAPESPTASDASAGLTPEEQLERFAQELKENDWGHQPC